MGDFKYVMFQIEIGECTVQEIPVIFPDVFVHKHVEQYLSRLFVREHQKFPKCVSAGFIRLGNVTTYGKSDSMNLESREEDASIIDSFICSHGLKCL